MKVRFLIVMVGIFFYLFCTSPESTKRIVPIQMKKIQQIVFENPNDFSIQDISDLLITDHSIYMIDKKNYAILQLSLSGKFVKKTGSKGQAPKEFLLPVKLFMHHNQLYVFDINGFKINVYDSNLDYVTTIPLPKTFGTYDFWVLNDSTLILATFEYESNCTNTSPIKFYNWKQKNIFKEFGKCDPVYTKYDIPNYRSASLFVDSTNKIYLFFPASERIYIYDQNGDFKKSVGEKSDYFKFVDQDIPISMEWDKKLKLFNHYTILYKVYAEPNFVKVIYQKFDRDFSFVNFDPDKIHYWMGEYNQNGQLVNQFTKLKGEPLYYDTKNHFLYVHESYYPKHIIGVYEVQDSNK